MKRLNVSRLIYRPEIDGLRAVAVIPVILFHAGMTVFSGGYVGVDVFFVISGYLITAILISELERGDFSIARFYERRARRILPALFFVILCCIPFAWMWMLPAELKDFSQSIVAVVFFASNILFWREEGYFAPAAELKPLLHTWSLAVEEQYYLLFPVFLLVMWRFGRNRVFWAICGAAAFSLLLSEWGWRNKPSANFYLAPMRAWELLAGSICAFWLSGRELRANNWLSLAGLGLIVLAIFYYDDATPFPSVYALAPVLGTALMILFGGAGTWTAKLLSTRGFVGIGLISYSAYLWHQPLFAFARLRSIMEPSPALMIALAALSLVLAYFSWRYIEKPFRKGQGSILPTRRSMFAYSGAVAATFAAVGVGGHLGNGFEGRFSRDVMRFVDAKADKASADCHFDQSRVLLSHPQKQCMSATSGAPDVMLIGDSHMWALTDALREDMAKKKINYYILSHTSCLPLSGFRTFDGPKIYDCNKFLERALDFASSKGIKTIVLAARFPLYLHGKRYDNQEGGVEVGDCGFVDTIDRMQSKCEDVNRESRVLRQLETQIRKLSNSFNVVLVQPIPEAGWDVPSTAFKGAYFYGTKGYLSTNYRYYFNRSIEVNTLFDRLERDLPNLYVARVANDICSKESGRCKNSDLSGVYYYDDDHLSNAGARLVAPTIVDAIESSLNR